METIFDTFLGLALGVIATYWAYNLFRKKQNQELTKHQSTVLLQQIKSVCKLITVEGDFAEIYTYENTKARFLSLISSKKKALIVINAKAQIGFDLKKIQMHADTENKRIHLTSFPQPEILSIQPELEFYDIQNGLFNAFKPEDITTLNQEAKKHIESKIPQSGLMETAQKEALQSVQLIEKIVGTIGWKLDYSALEIGEATRLATHDNLKNLPLNP